MAISVFDLASERPVCCREGGTYVVLLGTLRWLTYLSGLACPLHAGGLTFFKLRLQAPMFGYSLIELLYYLVESLSYLLEGTDAIPATSTHVSFFIEINREAYKYTDVHRSCAAARD